MTLSPPLGPDLKVLVLAGADSRGSLVGPDADQTRESPLVDKAFLPLRGQLVVEHVLDLLRACGLTRVWVLAPEHRLAQISTRHRFIPVPQASGARFFGNLSAGGQAMELQSGEPALLAFGDHPVTSPKALHFFLARCREEIEEADFFHAMALQEPYRDYARWSRRTSLHMREMCGRASGFTLAVPSRLHRLQALGKLYDVRKLERLDSFFALLWQLARALGRDGPHGVLDGMLLYLAKEMEKAGRSSGTAAAIARRLEAWFAARVPIRRLERYAARVLGAERGVRVVPVPHGGIAIDVDFAEELEMLEHHWDAVKAISERQDARIEISNV